MKNLFVKGLMIVACFVVTAQVCDAQTKKGTKRTSTKRAVAKKTTNSKTKVNINASGKDTAAAVIAPPVSKKIDSLPFEVVKKSLRPNDAVERNLVKDRVPLL